jgi:hypothetical protein
VLNAGGAVVDTDELIRQGYKRAELRQLLVDRGYAPPELPALKEIVLRCPDVDLALTALTMIPRPRWVLELVAPERTVSTRP